jgi:hypothetical protein
MRAPQTSAPRRLIGAGLVAGAATAIALSGATAQALSCDDFDVYGSAGPLDEGGADVPIDAQPWFTVACGDTPTCTLYADRELTSPLPSETTYRECVGDRGLALIAPEGPLSAGTTYYVDCEDYETRTFRVRDNTEPGQALSLDSATPRRELDDGCCRSRYLSIEFEFGGGELETFFAEGGLVAVEFADGSSFFETAAPYDPDLWTFPDSEEDVTITLVNANGTIETLTIPSEDFDRDLAYIPCTVNEVNRGIFGLWLLIPILWIRRHGARR